MDISHNSLKPRLVASMAWILDLIPLLANWPKSRGQWLAQKKNPLPIKLKGLPFFSLMWEFISWFRHVSAIKLKQIMIKGNDLVALKELTADGCSSSTRAFCDTKQSEHSSWTWWYRWEGKGDRKTNKIQENASNLQSGGDRNTLSD